MTLCCLREREKTGSSGVPRSGCLAVAAEQGGRVCNSGRSRCGGPKKKESVDGWRAHELDRKASAFDFAPALAARGHGSQAHGI